MKKLILILAAFLPTWSWAMDPIAVTVTSANTPIPVYTLSAAEKLKLNTIVLRNPTETVAHVEAQAVGAFPFGSSRRDFVGCL